jgi:beta-lactamase superfamily II metal-dependent hydrolase
MSRVKLIPIMSCLLFLSVAAMSPLAPQRRTLDIQCIDVEGGAATLIVTPAGESILVDTGWPGNDGRDAKRIQHAMQHENITAIDHLIITHYHQDHFGGVPALTALVPVKHFYDHGPMGKGQDRDPNLYAAYLKAAHDKTTALKPGDQIELRHASGTPAISLVCVASAGATLQHGNSSGHTNANCAGAKLQDEDPTDNAQSIALILRYGNFDFFDGGDLTWNVENRLACPENVIGQVDLYQVTHHGGNNSNNTTLMQSLLPTVAIMNNGARKGGHPDVVRWIGELPSHTELYQLHRNVQVKPEENACADHIANLGEENDGANAIEVSVSAAQKAFTVTNTRTGISKTYSIK